MVYKVLVGMLVPAVMILGSSSCRREEPGPAKAKDDKVTLTTVDPGHFHAALVQKTTYERVSPSAYVYAPAGAELDNYLAHIEQYNSRAEEPTDWQLQVYRGPDFFAKMLAEKPGNVVVLAGNNRKKTEYIKACIEAGLNVYADKPMAINAEDFALLETALATAQKKKVLLYDIMTERFEICSVLQKTMAHTPAVFGELQTGVLDEPAVVKESVHHFFKYVSGKPIQRPGWYFDTTQQGEGIVDVTTHLVDLTMWACFPQEAIRKEDVKVLQAKRWPTMITLEQYQKVTGLEDFEPYLKDKLSEEGVLPVYANGEIDYTLKGIHNRVRVVWNYQAPEGGKDMHYSIMRGSRANIVIKQGAEQNYRAELYVEPTGDSDKEALGAALEQALADLAETYPALAIEPGGPGYHVIIPDAVRIGHESHFRQVTLQFLDYLDEGAMPEWERANILAKYYITTTALELARSAEE